MKPSSQQTKLNFFSSSPNTNPKTRKTKPADKAPTPASALTRERVSLPIASTALPTSPASRNSSPSPTPPEFTMETLPDSTDWIKTTLPSFEPLEAALRCEVCKEFFENPVITTCSHTFCSLCIRRCVTNDGKCPACKAQTQTERLVPNFLVREIVSRFQEARPKALALAQRGEGATAMEGSKKRKIEETDIEEEEPVRQTRSRTTRSNTRRGNGMADAPFEVADSDEEQDAEFVPEDLVQCPICNAHMKEEAVWLHINNNCPGEPGEQKANGGRSTRPRANKAFSSPMRKQPKNPPPAPSRLPGLNFAMMKEAAIRKKLQELGIPHWGKKDLMIRRHTEWLHLWNANCDASEDKRKSKRELLRELDVWERTRGGNAHTTEATVMKKDFDAKGYATANRSQFDELIAAARKKKAAAQDNETTETTNENHNEDGQMEEPQKDDDPAVETEAQNTPDICRPYEGNHEAIASIREKVQETNRTCAIQPPTPPSAADESSMPKPSSQVDSTETGMHNPLGSPSRRLSMFALPADPIVDVDNSTSVP